MINAFADAAIYWLLTLIMLNQDITWPRVYKTFFILNSTEHENSTALN